MVKTCLLRHDDGCAADEVFLAVFEFEAYPSGAAFLEGLEVVFGTGCYVEACARGEVVKGNVLRGGVVGVVVPELCIDLLFDGAAEGDAGGVVAQQDGNIAGEDVEVLVYSPGIVGLPFVAVGLDVGFVLQPGVEVGHFVQQHQEEMVGIEVSVNAYLVVLPTALGPAVVAQFGVPLACDMEVYLVLGHEVEEGVDGFCGDVFGKSFFEIVNIGLFHFLLWRAAVLCRQRWGSRNGGVCGAWACARPCRCMRQENSATTGRAG